MRIKVAVWAIGTMLGAACGAPQTARAADTPPPVVKAPAAVPAISWTGFYLNGGFGYGLWTAESNTPVSLGIFDPAAPLVQRLGGKGWLGRVGIGYDYQFSSRIVAGVFADFDYSDLKGTLRDPIAGLSAEIKQSSAWAAGARAGWLINPRLLTYFNAGYSHAHFSSGTMVALTTGAPTPPGVPSGFVTPAFSESGWFLGGGTEASLGDGWFWRNEYRYAYYGNRSVRDINVFSTAPFPALNNIEFKPTVQTVTTQLVYKFNPGGPAYSAPAAKVAASWTGLYANAGVGYGMWVADETTTLLPGSDFPVLQPQRHSGKGWLGRVGGGYDYQFNRIVAGFMADFDLSSLKGSLGDAGHGIDGTVTQDWSWAAGGRVGWLIDPDILGFVNGGYTSAHYSSTILLSMFTSTQFARSNTPAFTTNGWFLGGGVEYAIAPGWFWRNEYRYSKLETASVPTFSDTNVFVGNAINFAPVVQTVTTQLVFKFNPGR